MKDKILGRGVKRIHYESRLQRMLKKNPHDLGIALGLSKQDSIMLAEIIEIKIMDELTKEINVLEGFVIFSPN